MKGKGTATAVEHPPHVNRLLRLIREGTPSHASRAAALLGRYAASRRVGVGGVWSSTPNTSTEDGALHARSNGGGSADGDAGDNSGGFDEPGVMVWDLIGRLVDGDGAGDNRADISGRGKRRKKNSRPTSGLFDPNWSTRCNCALALEHVARCLPLEDRRNFFEGDDHCDHMLDGHGKVALQESSNGVTTSTSSGEGKMASCNAEVLLWLDVNDLMKSIELHGEKSSATAPDTAATAVMQSRNQRNHLDIVAKRGRLLLSSSGEQYDWNCDEQANEYIREQEALKKLDAAAGADKINENSDQSFLTRRIKLQRKILAKRLGLGGILSAPIVAGPIPDENTSSSGFKRFRAVDDIVADEDLAPKLYHTSESKEVSPKYLKGKRANGSKKCGDEVVAEDTQKNKGSVMGIRALLVLESKRSANGFNSKGTSHRNPQTLLGSELAYRTFDPDWTVRHGALLGTLALLRAWKVHQVSCTPRCELYGTFGRWPQDILARCVCILALDQFADFSGVSCQNSTDATDSISSGAIVAPVREIAGQIIAILLEASPSTTCYCAHQLFMQLYTRKNIEEGERGSNGWESRHGVLLAWKYICAMALFSSRRNQQLQSRPPNDMFILRPLLTVAKPEHNDVRRSQSIFNKIILQSIHGLSDVNDDNQAVAAQILRYSLLIDESFHSTSVANECSKPLWDAIVKIRPGVSSCAADLLNLLAEVLSRDCNSFLSCLQKLHESFSLDSILKKLANFLDDDSAHMRMSCFCVLHLVAEPVAKAVLAFADVNKPCRNTTHDQSINECTSTMCQLLIEMFETYFSHGYIIESGTEESNDVTTKELINHRNQAWTSILNSIALLIQTNAKLEGSHHDITEDLFTSLTLRYLGVSRSPIPAKESKGQTNQAFQFTRVGNTIGARDMAAENSFCAVVSASRALAQFCEILCSKEQYANVAEKIGVIIQSPWLGQCEAGFLFHVALASVRPNPTSNTNPFFIKYLTYESTPTSILLTERISSSKALDDTRVQSICDNGLATMLNTSENSCLEWMVQLWEKAFAQKGISFADLRKSPNKSLTKESMRLSASIAGALVACGSKHLPPKVTPLIRALMTSLKNEQSHKRQIETCRYISQLVSMLSKRDYYEKARNRLIENVCVIACNTNRDSLIPLEGAEHVVELIVASMKSNNKLEDFTPMWERLSPLLKQQPSDALSQPKLPDAIRMLGIVSRAISKNCPPFRFVLNSFAKSAVCVACGNDSELIRAQASMSITNFCKIDFCATMDVIVPSLLPALTNLQNDQERKSGCILLLSILHDFEVLVAPYVTTLLPIAMRLMTDSIEQCSRSAASAFAILVRIAPLSASHTGNSMDAGSSWNPSDDVVRHLILGKPLPPCSLPDAILSKLKESGISLRPYQWEGISWLKFLTDVHLNGALCDDMGLGKTLQALIAVAMSHHNKPGEIADPSNSNSHIYKKSIVICPSSVVGHWVSEIQRFFHKEVFLPFDFTGNGKARRASWRKGVAESNVVVTSYSVLRNDIDLLENVMWDWCILDEGHLLKNPKTSTSKASRRLKCSHRLILTGTPIQNNVHEIWATFDFLMPNFLGTESNFLKEFAKPIIKSQEPDASPADIHQGMETLKILHQQVLPFVLRREKSQVIKELPPKIITDIPCCLSKQQRLMYERTLKNSGTKKALEMVNRALVEAEEQQSDTMGSARLGSNVIASLVQLRLICTHPLLHSLFSLKTAHVTDTFAPSFTRLDCSGKLSALNDLLRHAGIAEPEMTAADNDESGFLVDMSEHFPDDTSDVGCVEHGTTDSLEGTRPVNFPAATPLSKCLIFAQFIQSLDIVERFLFEPLMPSLHYLRLDGRVPASQRIPIVERFNQDADVKVLLLTTKVGGLGLNLTGADKVIFLENSYNPFVDLQAMDRAHRIGQTKTVNVYRLVTSGTIEEQIMNIQQRKKATSEAIVNAENSTMFSMGTDRLLDIFTCRGDSSTAAQQQGLTDDDNVLSYLDDTKSNEYGSLSVDNFLRTIS